MHLTLRSDFEKMLIFLWRWKFASIAAISEKFFPNSKSRSAYKALFLLKKLGMVEYQYFPLSRKKAAWTLTTKGFNYVRELLPPLREEGFRSESVNHDWLTTAFHMGDWLKQVPMGCALFSEQQLRRYRTEDYPEWVPKTNLHRPDGYWHVPMNGGKAIALEVELNTKSSAKYEFTAAFYADQPNISKVIWLATGHRQAATIRSRLKLGSQSSNDIHDFVLINDFLKDGWQAQARLGPGHGSSVIECLGNVGGTYGVHGTSRYLLDLSKTPFRSETYAREKENRFGHRVGFLPTPPTQPASSVSQNSQAAQANTINQRGSTRE